MNIGLIIKSIIGYSISFIPEFKEKNYNSLLKWCYRFMSWNNLIIWLAGHLGQQLPKNILNRFYNFFHNSIQSRLKLDLDDNR